MSALYSVDRLVNNGHQEYGDEDIVAMVQGSSAEIDSEEVNAQTELISHTDAAKALDLAFNTLHQHQMMLCSCGDGGTLHPQVDSVLFVRKITDFTS